MCGDALVRPLEHPLRILQGTAEAYQESNRSLSRQPGSRLRGVAALPQAVAKRLRRTGKGRREGLQLSRRCHRIWRCNFEQFRVRDGGVVHED